jgi:hypothetical protein
MSQLAYHIGSVGRKRAAPPLELRLTFLVPSVSIGLLVAVALLLWLRQPGVSLNFAAPAAPWVIFASPTTTTSNLLTNPGFELGSSVTATGWNSFGIDADTYTYTIDDTGGRSGSRALQVFNQVPTDTLQGGAIQVIVLNQAQPKPIRFSGWSRFACAGGAPSGDYSVYLDVHTDDGPSWGHTQTFDTDVCGWQFREGYIVLDSPIQSIHVHCLLHWDKVGTAWFDNLTVQEIDPELWFDSVPVSQTSPSSPPYGGAALSLSTADGLTLTFSAQGGAVTSVTVRDQPVHDPERAYASGFFVHDVASLSDFVHVGGGLAQEGSVIRHTSTITDLGLDFAATYTATDDRIAIHAELTNT